NSGSHPALISNRRPAGDVGRTASQRRTQQYANLLFPHRLGLLPRLSIRGGTDCRARRSTLGPLVQACRANADVQARSRPRSPPVARRGRKVVLRTLSDRADGHLARTASGFAVGRLAALPTGTQGSVRTHHRKSGARESVVASLSRPILSSSRSIRKGECGIA